MAQPGEALDSALIRGAGGLWEQATRAPFLDAVASGEIAPEAFSRWLAQDYLFARDLLSFQSLLLSRAPRGAQAVLIGGLAAIEQELGWFESHASRLGLTLDVEPLPACRAYNDYLVLSGYEQPFPGGAAILFGVEVSYLAAWSALKPQGPYAEFIERWSSPRFADYVDSLKTMVEAHPHPEQQNHFNRVLEHEREFWRMAWEG